QAGARVAALIGAAQQEVAGDRVQAQPRQRAPAVTADAPDQPDRKPATAFAPLLPAAVHAATPSPLASNWPSPSTPKRQRGAGAPGPGEAISSIAIRAACPGSSGRRNFTCGKRSAPSGPCAASIASSTRSTITIPGTIGRPGKCPGRAGWSSPITNPLMPGP